MGTKKEATLKRAKKLGKIVKKLSNGMYETSEGAKVAPYPGIEINDEVRIDENGKLVVPEKKAEKTAGDDAAVSRAEYEALLEKTKKLEALVGEKGSDVKAGGDEGGDK
jgi:hypothetical protein